LEMRLDDRLCALRRTARSSDSCTRVEYDAPQSAGVCGRTRSMRHELRFTPRIGTQVRICFSLAPGPRAALMLCTRPFPTQPSRPGVSTRR
jgi:hypothetical protein